MENSQLIERLNLISDIGLHAMILFIFLTAFFLLFISKMEVSALEGQLGGLINNDIGNYMQQIKSEYGEDSLKFLNILPFDTLLKNYSTPDPYQVNNNNWLVKSLIITNVLLFVIIIGSIIMLKLVCNYDVNIREIVFLNAITFMFVGGIEYMFFTKVGLKYVPAPPSLMMDTIFGNVKKYFS
jgi:hypothetical protein